MKTGLGIWRFKAVCLVISGFGEGNHSEEARIWGKNHHEPAGLCEIPCVNLSTVEEPHDCTEPGAIGFDWVTGGQGGVPRLISWPRKKLITNNCKTAVFSRSLITGCADLRISA